MAKFKIAYSKTKRSEAGWANHPDDTGGETWKGIAQKKNPQWPGWKIVDLYKGLPNFPLSLYTAPGLQDLVDEFYKVKYWDRMRGDEIQDQDKADQIFDMCVNAGVPVGIKLAQVTLFDLIGDDDARKAHASRLGISYGVMDNKTLNALNA